MVTCSVDNCFSTHTDHSLFKVSTKSAKRQSWIEFLRQNRAQVHENVEYRICELHFKPSDIKVNPNKRKILKPKSKPTIVTPQIKADHQNEDVFDDAPMTDPSNDTSEPLQHDPEFLLQKIEVLEEALRRERLKSRCLVAKAVTDKIIIRRLEAYLRSDQIAAAYGKKTCKSSISTILITEEDVKQLMIDKEKLLIKKIRQKLDSQSRNS